MNPTEIMNLALLALNQILSLIAMIRGQGGLSDDTINAAALTAAQGNDTLYQQMIAAINGPTAFVVSVRSSVPSIPPTGPVS